jgi:hypothetical protein
MYFFVLPLDDIVFSSLPSPRTACQAGLLGLERFLLFQSEPETGFFGDAILASVTTVQM